MHDTHRLCFVGLTAVFLAALGTAIVSAQAAPSGKTVWDGVYTDAQAERATATFSASCARCHTLSADGNRPLSGDKFWEGYTQKTVADLLAFVSKNMPNGQGGTLPAAARLRVKGAMTMRFGTSSGPTAIGVNRVGLVLAGRSCMEVSVGRGDRRDLAGTRRRCPCAMNQSPNRPDAR